MFGIEHCCPHGVAVLRKVIFWEIDKVVLFSYKIRVLFIKTNTLSQDSAFTLNLLTTQNPYYHDTHLSSLKCYCIDNILDKDKNSFKAPTMP